MKERVCGKAAVCLVTPAFFSSPAGSYFGDQLARVVQLEESGSKRDKRWVTNRVSVVQTLHTCITIRYPHVAQFCDRRGIETKDSNKYARTICLALGHPNALLRGRKRKRVSRALDRTERHAQWNVTSVQRWYAKLRVLQYVAFTRLVIDGPSRPWGVKNSRSACDPEPRILRWLVPSPLPLFIPLPTTTFAPALPLAPLSGRANPHEPSPAA